MLIEMSTSILKREMIPVGKVTLGGTPKRMLLNLSTPLFYFIPNPGWITMKLSKQETQAYRMASQKGKEFLITLAQAFQSTILLEKAKL